MQETRRWPTAQLPSRAKPGTTFKLANDCLGLRVASPVGVQDGAASPAAAWNTALSRLAASTVRESGGMMIIRVPVIGRCST